MRLSCKTSSNFHIHIQKAHSIFQKYFICDPGTRKAKKLFPFFFLFVCCFLLLIFFFTGHGNQNRKSLFSLSFFYPFVLGKGHANASDYRRFAYRKESWCKKGRGFCTDFTLTDIFRFFVFFVFFLAKKKASHIKATKICQILRWERERERGREGTWLTL